MSVSKLENVTLPELAVFAVTRGAIGFGAGLLLSDRFGRHRRKVVGWSLFLSGVASTVPIAMHFFKKRGSVVTQA
jgi:hypothetical protein